MSYREDTLYIYCHGFFSPKEVEFLQELAVLASENVEFLHWGDMDYGGIRIFLFNKEKIFPKLKPYPVSYTHLAEKDRTVEFVNLLNQSNHQKEILQKLASGMQLTERYKAVTDRSLYRRKNTEKEKFTRCV